MFFTEMAAAGLFARQSVEAHQLRKLHKVCNPTGLLQGLIELFIRSENADRGMKLFAEFRDAFQSAFESGLCRTVTTSQSDAPSSRWNDSALRPPLQIEEFLGALGHFVFLFLEFAVLGVYRSRAEFSEVIAQGVRKDKVAVRQALHQRACAQAIRAVMEKFASPTTKRPEWSTSNGSPPKVHHGVVRCRVNLHGNFVGVGSGNALVHLEEVVVALDDGFLSEAFNGIAEVEIYAATHFTNTTTFVADFFGAATGDAVARRQIAVARILAFQIVVAFSFRDGVRSSLIAGLFWNPHASVVA